VLCCVVLLCLVMNELKEDVEADKKRAAANPPSLSSYR